MPFGGDQAYKGFALALLVETAVPAWPGSGGHAAVALLASPVAAPMEAIRIASRRQPRARGRRLPRVTAPAPRAGRLELPDDLWRWLEAV